MKKRIVITAAFVATLLILVCAAASAASVNGWEELEFQVDLSTERPANGGFFSRGCSFGCSDFTSSSVAWSVTSVDGPALTITPESEYWTTQAWLNLDPNEVYTAGTSYEYTIQATAGSEVASTKVKVSYVNPDLPSGYGLTLTPLTLTDTSATPGASAAVTNGEMYMVAGDTYIVGMNADVGQTGMSYHFVSARWTNTEWEMLDVWNDSLGLDGGTTNVCTAKKTGKYDHDYGLHFYRDGKGTNLGCYIPYTLYVTDANGNIPAPAPELVNHNWVDWNAKTIDYPVYTNIPLYSENIEGNIKIGLDSAFANVFIDNWQELLNEYGGAPQWAVSASPNDLDFRTQYSGDNYQLWCYLNSTPSKDYTVTVTCTWGGQTSSKTFNLKTSTLASLPTGISGISDEITTQVGQTLVLEPEIVPAGYSATGYAGSNFCANGLYDFTDRDWSQSTPTYTVRTAGIFKDYIGLRFGSLLVTKPVSFKVADASGNIPSASLNIRVGQREKNVYLGMPEFSMGGEEEGIFGEPGSAYVFFNGYQELKKLYPNSEPQWSIRRMDGKDAGIREWNEDYIEPMDQSYCFFVLDDTENDPGKVEYEITCAFGPLTSTDTLTINYIDGPKTLPTGLDYPDTINHVKMGDTLTIEPHAQPAGWTIPDAAYSYVYTTNMEDFATQDRAASTSEKLVYTLDKAGTFSANVVLQIDSVFIVKEVTFFIADENGNVPKPVPEILKGYAHDRCYWIAPGLTPGEQAFGKLLADDYIEILTLTNQKVCEKELSGNPVWSVQANDYVALKVDDQGREELYLKKMPASAMDLTVDITCTWDGQASTEEYTIHFMQQPVALPTRVNFRPANQVIFTKVGESFDYYIELTDGSGLDCYETFYMLLSDNLQDIAGWDLIPTQSGVFEGYMETGVDNLLWREKLTLVVTEPDGTMKAEDYIPFGTVVKLPENLKKIESEAFAGTKLTEVDIPAGTEIAQDAFDDTGLIAVYTHNDKNAIDWAVQEGIIALTD